MAAMLLFWSNFSSKNVPCTPIWLRGCTHIQGKHNQSLMKCGYLAVCRSHDQDTDRSFVLIATGRLLSVIEETYSVLSILDLWVDHCGFQNNYSNDMHAWVWVPENICLLCFETWVLVHVRDEIMTTLSFLVGTTNNKIMLIQSSSWF